MSADRKTGLSREEHVTLKGYAALRKPDGSKAFSDSDLGDIFKISAGMARAYRLKPVKPEPKPKEPKPKKPKICPLCKQPIPEVTE